ncbi:hypothetical protein J1605_015363 [Eschrichtius robustus]|uniref:Breakpoint cluster region protein n=1 Tax=Eschrichtius robustus TaxID=9764 RepID=A0AB34GAJ2_ESCRO|nr:hypothetical protein J1605_015363 [Eschrichtius robustus]
MWAPAARWPVLACSQSSRGSSRLPTWKEGPLPLPHSYRKPSLVSPDEGAAASSPPRAAVFGQLLLCNVDAPFGTPLGYSCATDQAEEQRRHQDGLPYVDDSPSSSPHLGSKGRGSQDAPESTKVAAAVGAAPLAVLTVVGLFPGARAFTLDPLGGTCRVHTGSAGSLLPRGASARDVASVSELDLEKGSEMRKWVLSGILASEETYLSHLEALLLPMKPLKAAATTSQPVLTNQQIETIFFKVPELYEIHKEFYDSLLPRLQQWSHQQRVGDLFQKLCPEHAVKERQPPALPDRPDAQLAHRRPVLAHTGLWRSARASQLGVYRAFVDNYGVAMETAEKCCQANAQFAEISENLRARSNKDAKDQTTKNSLESEFSMPRPLHAPVVAATASRQEQPGPPAGVLASSLTPGQRAVNTEAFECLLLTLLYKPVDRVTRSTLVLHDLLKHTPSGHPDHLLLQDALRISQNFLSSINEEITPRRQSMTVKKGEPLPVSISLHIVDERVWNRGAQTPPLPPPLLPGRGPARCQAACSKMAEVCQSGAASSCARCSAAPRLTRQDAGLAGRLLSALCFHTCVGSAQHSASPDEVAGTVCQLNYRLTSMCPGNFTPPPPLQHRQLLKDSFMVELVEGARKLRHVFLFTDLLLCTKLKKQSGGKTQQYDCKWYIPLTDLSFQTVDDSEAAPNIPLVLDEELDAMKIKISQIKSDIQREKRANKGSKAIERLRKKLSEQESLLLLMSPSMAFRVHSRNGKSYTFLISSDYERAEWRENIREQQKKCFKSFSLTSVELQMLTNSCVKLQTVHSIPLTINKEDDESPGLYGFLNVIVHSATGFKQSSSLYCTLEVDSFGYFVNKAKTRVYRDTAEPNWNEEFEIELEGSQTLRILCYEKCYNKSKITKEDGESADRIMGKGQVQVRLPPSAPRRVLSAPTTAM